MKRDCSECVNPKMKVALPTLKTLLELNVVELKFTRRRPKPGVPPTRRMLCTNSNTILRSEPGRKLLHYQDPVKLNPSYNPRSKNIVIAWDILVQDFRCVSVDDCDVVQIIEDDEQFWKYYNDVLYPMTPQQKTVYMMS